MTDGRTGQRGACWSVTAWGDEIENLTDKERWPHFVTKVYGGLEECPETKRIHYQGCVVLAVTQRLAAMKKWMPKAHWEVARREEALKQYAMKKDTAVGEKVVICQDKKNVYLRPDDVMMRLARLASEWYDTYLKTTLSTETLHITQWICTEVTGDMEPILDYRFLRLTRAIVNQDVTFVRYLDSKAKKLWIDYHYEFIKNVNLTDRIPSITDSVKESLKGSDETDSVLSEKFLSDNI